MICYYFLIAAVLVSEMGSAAGQSACYNASVDALNNYTATIQAALGQMLNSSEPTAIEYQHILNATCEDANIRPIINKIAEAVAGCPELATSDVGNLSLGDTDFLKLLQRFSSINNFCECKEAMLSAIALDNISGELNLVSNVTDGAYTQLINVTNMCQAEIFNVTVSKMILYIGSFSAKCPSLYEFTTFIPSNTALAQMSEFVSRECSMVDRAGFECAVNASRSSAFKACLKLISADESKNACQRSNCVTAHIVQHANCTSMAAQHYIYAVNMQQPTIVLDVKSTTTCGSSVLTMSLLVSVVSFSLIFVL